MTNINIPFFTHQHANDGKIAIGKLPQDAIEILIAIKNVYYNMIPDRNVTTYHTYYRELPIHIRKLFDKIQSRSTWDKICDEKTQNMAIVPYMNELYYSNPNPNFEKGNLYGAAANLIPHRDCILFYFLGISFYRIIIGLTDENTDTITYFNNFNIGHCINTGDYLCFDFDKTLHQVKKMGDTSTPRILLKLHFIVCEKKYSAIYMNFISYFYIWYYIVARYTESIGTDPKTFIGFFYGILWEIFFYKKITYCLFGGSMVSIFYFHNIQRLNYIVSIGYSMKSILFIYLFIVSYFTVRYNIYKIR
jgi:hypothetical protein